MNSEYSKTPIAHALIHLKPRFTMEFSSLQNNASFLRDCLREVGFEAWKFQNNDFVLPVVQKGPYSGQLILAQVKVSIKTKISYAQI